VEEVATLTLRIIKAARWTPLTATVATREQANAGRIPGGRWGLGRVRVGLHPRRAWTPDREECVGTLDVPLGDGGTASAPGLQRRCRTVTR